LEVPIVVKSDLKNFMTVGSSNCGEKWLKNKTVGARIRTHEQAPIFTMIGNYDRCEMSFSKYQKKNASK
jgi:hypothetical protein